MKALRAVQFSAASMLLAAAALAQHSPPAHSGHANMKHSPEGGRPLSARLTGAAEVPGPGDRDGGGSATLRVNAGQGQVCYTLTVTRIDPATAAHIHTGAAGVAGPVAVGLEAPSDGSSEGCATVTRALAMALIRNPSGYYVNVHNAAFPAGAVRGQLGR